MSYCHLFALFLLVGLSHELLSLQTDRGKQQYHINNLAFSSTSLEIFWHWLNLNMYLFYQCCFPVQNIPPYPYCCGKCKEMLFKSFTNWKILTLANEKDGCFSKLRQEITSSTGMAKNCSTAIKREG